MATVKTFRVDGSLSYNDIDDNFDNLNEDKIERIVSVNDASAAISITQTGSGDSLVINTNEFVVDSNGDVGIGTDSPRASFDVVATDAIVVPNGNSSQRVDVEGAIRKNTDTNKFEGYVGGRWKQFSDTLNISKITSGGYNGIQVFGENEIYFTSGSTQAWAAFTNSKTNNYVYSYGLGQFQKIIIPGTSKVIDSGSLGHRGASYALCENGDLYTWGYNSVGQCGVGNTSVVVTPTLAQSNVVRVFSDPSNGGYSIDQSRMLIQKDDGYLWATGYNGYGQFGNGNTTNSSVFVRLTNFGTNIKNAWNMGTTYGCIIVQKNDNNVLIAGSNINGYFGNGNTVATGSGSPTNITSFWLPDTSYEIKYVGGAFGFYDTAGSSRSNLLIFAENSSGTQVIRTAGNNEYGQVGNGSTSTTVSTPYNFTISKPIKQVDYYGGIATGYILYTDGTLYSWGYNGRGQVGYGNTSSILSPILVLSDVKTLPSNGFNADRYGYDVTAFAVKNDGSLWATGYNDHGQCSVGHVNSVTSFTRCIIPVYQNNTIKYIGIYSTAASGSVIVAIRDDNEIFGWGYNGHSGVVLNASGTNVYAAMNFKINRV